MGKIVIAFDDVEEVGLEGAAGIEFVEAIVSNVFSCLSQRILKIRLGEFFVFVSRY